MNPLARFAGAVALACALFAAPALALDSGDIVVASTKGEVHVTMNGVEKTVRAGGVVIPPAAIRTGHDGAIELKQGKTSVNVGPDTQLEFPALETAGGPIDRIVQPKGNAFYDIGKREGRRLRVETPYLVGVIKGTQFNVASETDATTISLFEGRLEIRATDESAPVVDLLAGNIAARHRGEKTISVMKMNPDKAAPTARPTSQGGSGNGGGAERPAVTTTADVVADELRTVTEPPADTRVGANVDVRPVGETNVTAGVDVRGGNAGADVATNVDVDTGAANANVGASVAVDTGPNGASVGGNVGVSANVGNVTTIDTNVSPSVTVAPTGVSVGGDVGVSANLGATTIETNVAPSVTIAPTGVTAGVDTGVSANVGNVTTIETNVSPSVTVAPTGVAVGADVGTTASVGNVATVDAGATAAVNTATNTVAANVDTSANVAGVNAGVTAGTNVTAGTVNVGASLGTVAVNVGVDLGLDDKGGTKSGGTDDTSTGSTTTTTGSTTTTTGNLTNLLDSLLGHGKKKK